MGIHTPYIVPEDNCKLNVKYWAVDRSGSLATSGNPEIPESIRAVDFGVVMGESR